MSQPSLQPVAESAPAPVRHRVPLLSSVGLSLLLCAVGGPPFWHWDSIVTKAFQAVANGGDPRFFNYPGLVIYCNVLIYKLVYAVLHALGKVASWEAFTAMYKTGYMSIGGARVPYTLPGQFVTLCFVAAGLAATYYVGYHLSRSRAVAALAVLLTGTSLFWVQNAHFDTVDAPLAAMCMLTLWFTFRWAADPDRSVLQSVLLGVCVGLTAGAKYNGGVVGVGVAVAGLLALGPRRIWPWLRQMAYVAEGAALGFYIANPFVLRSADLFWRDFHYESLHAYVTGHFGAETKTPLVSHAWQLVDLAGVVPVVLAAVGLVVLVLDRKVAAARKYAVLSFVLVFAAIIYRSMLMFDRYQLPLIPILMILAAIGLKFLYEAAGRLRGRLRELRWAVVALVALLVGQGLYLSVRHDVLMLRRDTREQFLSLMAEVPLEAKSMAAGDYVQLIYDGGGKYKVENIQGFSRRALLITSDLVALDSFSLDRYIMPNIRPERTLAFKLAVSPLRGWHALSISPYDRPRELVLLSDKNNFSPNADDIRARLLPGPYIELYAREEGPLKKLKEACDARGFRCELFGPEQGYFYRMSQERELDLVPGS